METRIVEIEKYWAAVVGNAAEFKQIAAAENPEFNSLSSCILRVLGEAFIQDATEYGVARWESMLGITPTAGDTLEQRKVRVLTYLNMKLPYTWRMLKQMIASYVGEDNFELKYINDTSTLIVRVITEDEVVYNDIQLLLSKVVPQNVVIDLDYGVELKFNQLVAYYKENGSDGKAYTMFGGRLVVDNSSTGYTATTIPWANQPVEYIVTLRELGGELFRTNKLIGEIKGIYAPNMIHLSTMFYYSTITKLPENELWDRMQSLSYTFEGVKLTSLPESFTCRNCYNFNNTFFNVSLTSLPANFTMESAQYANNCWNARSKLPDEDYARALSTLPHWSDGKTHNISIGSGTFANNYPDVVTEVLTKGWTLLVNGTAVTVKLDTVYVFIIDTEGTGYLREDGTEVGLIQCDYYLAPEGITYEEVEAENEEEAAAMLNLTINPDKERI